MRSRLLATFVVACLAALLVAGCGDDSDGATGGHSTKELASTPGAGGSDSDSGSDSGSGSSDSPEVTLPDGSDPSDITLPDMSDFGDLGDCMAAATAFASLAASALGDEASAAQAESALDQLKTELPEELRADIEILADAYATIAEEGFLAGAEALDTPEVNAASDRISTYFEEECSGG